MSIAIVTGASSGIGYALAEALVRRGDTVDMTGRRDSIHAAAQLAERARPGHRHRRPSRTLSMIASIRMSG